MVAYVVDAEIKLCFQASLVKVEENEYFALYFSTLLVILSGEKGV